jgi:hypothetical protein
MPPSGPVASRPCRHPRRGARYVRVDLCDLRCATGRHPRTAARLPDLPGRTSIHRVGRPAMDDHDRARPRPHQRSPGRRDRPARDRDLPVFRGRAASAAGVYPAGQRALGLCLPARRCRAAGGHPPRRHRRDLPVTSALLRRVRGMGRHLRCPDPHPHRGPGLDSATLTPHHALG